MANPSFAEALTDAAFSGDLNAVGRVWNPLHAAIENNQIATVRLLLNVEADPNFRYNGWPALHHAIDSEMDGYTQTNAAVLPSAELVTALVEAGTDINIVHEGQTALQFAEWYHHEEAIKYFQSQGGPLGVR